MVRRTGIAPKLIDDVIGGAVGQIGEQSLNTTRWAALAAGLPEPVPAVTIDRQCGSGRQAIHFAAQAVRSGDYDLVIASGVESMSTVAIGSQTLGREPFGVGIARRYPEGLVPQGISAELIAPRWGLSRERLDGFAAESHRRAAVAWKEGRFDDEVTSGRITRSDGTSTELLVDESIRPATTVEVLAGLPAAFRNDAFAARFPQIGWTVTAGNSSPVNDGAAAVLIASSDTARRLGLRPRGMWPKWPWGSVRCE